MPTPAFNVYEPFQGVTIVALNDSMASLLVDFIDGVDEAHSDMALLAYALEGSSRRCKNTKFGVASGIINEITDQRSGETLVSNVSALALNYRMSRHLQNLIDEYSDDIERELVAFRMALANPEQSREIRESKLRDRDRDRDEDEYERPERSERPERRERRAVGAR